jgi:hypothetical protein
VLPPRTPSIISCARPRWGLGNRLRSLLGARALAGSEQRTLLYAWPTGRHFGARLTDLWQFDAPQVSTALSAALSWRYPYRGADLDWLDDARGDWLWQIRTGHELQLPAGLDWTEDLRRLRPTRAVAQRVATFFEDHLSGRPYLGVMVRAHEVSHAETRQHSPVAWYLARIRQIRNDRPQLPIFLSCDVPEVQHRLLAEFGNAYALDDKGGYNTRVGLQSAVVDLYLLASAAHLVGPHYSSFPELALHLAAPHVRLETSQTGPWGELASADLTYGEDPTRPWLRPGR